MSRTPHIHNTDKRGASGRNRPVQLVISLLLLGFGVYKLVTGTSELINGAGLVAGLGIAVGIVGSVTLIVIWSVHRQRSRQSGGAPIAQP